MSEWQPTEAQIEAALSAHIRSLRVTPEGAAIVRGVNPNDADDDPGGMHFESMRAALIAAHAAAEPVDTTEFEDVANRLIDAAMTLQAAQHGSEIERQATIDVDKRVDALVDLYVKAATR